VPALGEQALCTLPRWLADAVVTSTAWPKLRGLLARRARKRDRDRGAREHRERAERGRGISMRAQL
jgi:hypothetical protein